MTQAGQVVFSKMEEVVWGKPAAETVAALAQKRGAERVFLMLSGTLNRTTDEIDKLRRALGNKCVGTFDSMPPHTPRAAVIEAANMARDAGADLIVTVGGGSMTDGAKAVQLCLANDIRSPDALDQCRAVPGPDGTAGPPPSLKPPIVRQITVPTTEPVHVMSRLRIAAPSDLAGQKVTSTSDLTGGTGDLPSADVLRYWLPRARVVIRPGGTEPKIKAYLEIIEPVIGGHLTEARRAARARMDPLREAVRELLKG